MGNAIKFTETGHIRVHVSVMPRGDCQCGCANPGNTLLLFSVVDTGVGVPYEAQGKLMQEFSQVRDGVFVWEKEMGTKSARYFFSLEKCTKGFLFSVRDECTRVEFFWGGKGVGYHPVLEICSASE